MSSQLIFLIGGGVCSFGRDFQTCRLYLWRNICTFICGRVPRHFYRGAHCVDSALHGARFPNRGNPCSAAFCILRTPPSVLYAAFPVVQSMCRAISTMVALPHGAYCTDCIPGYSIVFVPCLMEYIVHIHTALY